MQIIEIKTLIDITCTGVIRLSQGTQIEINQNRNFTTLKQCAELRSIISFDLKPIFQDQDINLIGFGSDYQGIQRVWTFKFMSDHTDVYSDEYDPLGKLREDVHNVPIIKNLSETINIQRAVFDCKTRSSKNTLIMAHYET